MKHQIQITFDLDDTEHFSHHTIKVKLDDEFIGCIQNIKFEADCNKPLAELDITFPDPSIWGTTLSDLKEAMEKKVNILRQLLGVQIYYDDRVIKMRNEKQT